ncbi:MAG: hypothetical protein LUD15_03290 [Bacteroides sp.]|nr:hypothetical protein [Bacteroides sp.]
MYLILFLFCFTGLSAQNKLTIEEVSRQTSPEVTEKVRFETLSSEENLSVRTTESFEKTQLNSGEYSYIALLDPELATCRKIYISAPLVIETEYNISGLKAGEHIIIRVNVPRTELTIEPKPNLTPSKNSTAIYQFYATIPDLQITTDSGLQFANKGKDQSAFYIYELIVEVKDTPGLNLTIRADGYDEIKYTIDDVSQRIYGFFIFPKNAEECFNKNSPSETNIIRTDSTTRQKDTID